MFYWTFKTMGKIKSKNQQKEKETYKFYVLF